MALPHDLNKNDSYENLMGSPKRAHEGSQSQGHMAGGSAGYSQMPVKGGAEKGSK